MAERLKDQIEAALENLEAEQLKRFKRKLNEAQVEPGYNNIPRGALQSADPMDVADKIVDFYREEYGVRLTAQTLEAINEKPLADRLRGGTGAGRASGSSVPPATNNEAGASGGARPAPAEQHFVDRHRAEIIARTSLVDPILDKLFPGLLTREQYDTIRSKDTSQNKMRELYGYVGGWGQSDKDRLYEVLEAKNAPLIIDLRGQ